MFIRATSGLVYLGVAFLGHLAVSLPGKLDIFDLGCSGLALCGVAMIGSGLWGMRSGA